MPILTLLLELHHLWLIDWNWQHYRTLLYIFFSVICMLHRSDYVFFFLLDIPSSLEMPWSTHIMIDEQLLKRFQCCLAALHNNAADANTKIHSEHNNSTTHCVMGFSCTFLTIKYQAIYVHLIYLFIFKILRQMSSYDV